MSTYAAAIERRTLSAGNLTLKYYTSQPGPSQWIAVGTLALEPRDGAADVLRLLVGAGASEESAIDHLRQRLDLLSASLAC